MSSLALVRAIQEPIKQKDNTSDRNLEEGEKFEEREGHKEIYGGGRI